MTEATIVGRCRVCDRPLVSKTDWQLGIRPPGATNHGGKQLCIMHYTRLKRHGTFEKTPPKPRARRRGSVSRPIEEVLDEYAMIKDDVKNIREAAERMGMSFSALDTALYRARKRGLPGATPPLSQQEAS